MSSNEPTAAGPPLSQRLVGLVPILLGVVVLLTCAWLLYDRLQPRETTGDVRAAIESLALARSTTPGLEDGGPLGAWWIFADAINPATGEMHGFRLTSGGTTVAAEAAAVHIDAQRDEITFDLRSVVLMTVPSEHDAEAAVLSLDTYTLGPIAYGADIVEGEVSPGREQPPAVRVESGGEPTLDAEALRQRSTYRERLSTVGD